MLTVDTEKELSSENETVIESAVSENLKSIRSLFDDITVTELESAILAVEDRNDKILYRTLLNLKMQLDQEKIINQTLL